MVELVYITENFSMFPDTAFHIVTLYLPVVVNSLLLSGLIAIEYISYLICLLAILLPVFISDNSNENILYALLNTP